jgi:hypothetical protein
MGLTASAQRMDEHLLPFVDSLLAVHPDKLVARSHLCAAAASFLTVTRQAVSGRIADAVADGKLIEIFPRSDWLVMLLGGTDLPNLYAVQSGKNSGLYGLVRDRPVSRGSGGVSFITTDAALRELVTGLRKEYGLPDPGEAFYYVPAIERHVRADAYMQMLEVLSRYRAHSPGDASNALVVNELLAVVNLKPPQGH